jgi:hypothetical protein
MIMELTTIHCRAGRGIDLRVLQKREDVVGSLAAADVLAVDVDGHQDVAHADAVALKDNTIIRGTMFKKNTTK